MRNGPLNPTAGLTARLTRRQALRVAGLAGLGIALLSACAPQSPAPAKPAESKPAGAAPAADPYGAAPAAPPAPQAAPAAPSKPAEAAKPAGPAPKDGGVLRFSLHTENAPNLDPYLNVSFRSQEFAAFFYSRLLMSKKGPGIPGQAYIMEGDLAEKWEVSPDGKTYTFHLRPEAKWHNKPPMNGRAVTAQDVAWSFERFMKVSPQKTTFEQVAEVSATNERTVVFKLKDVYAPFEAAIGAPLLWIMPRELIEQEGDASKKVVGSGPFVFDKYESGVGFYGKKKAPSRAVRDPPAASLAAWGSFQRSRAGRPRRPRCRRAG
jgi:ABC-type transport system substrate-binding protein